MEVNIAPEELETMDSEMLKEKFKEAQGVLRCILDHVMDSGYS